MSGFVPDLSVQAFDTDPYPAYAYLRRHEPVRWMPWAHAYFVTRWDDVAAMAADPVTFSAAVHDSPLSIAIGPNLLHSEGDFHRQLRTPLTAALRPAAVAARMQSVVNDTVRELLDALPSQSADGEVDLIAAFAQPLAIRVITEVTGLPALSAQTFIRWLEGIAAGASNYERDPVKAAAAAAVNGEIDEALAQVLRDGAIPGSLIEVLSATPIDGRPITLTELAATVKLLIIGGMQEPRDLFGYALSATMAQPAIADRLRAQPAVVGSVIEEALRWGSPVGTVTRRTTRAVTLSGIEVPAGAILAGVLSSANRDERHWDRPEEFDIDRADLRHLAFNAGPHACVGASLARLEASTALLAVLERFPNVSAAGPPTVHGWEFRGPTALPVRLGRAATGSASSPATVTAPRQAFRPVEVVAAELLAGDVLLVTVAAADGAPLPTAEAGAHIDVLVPGEGDLADPVVRQYSLTGAHITTDRWQFAVRRRVDGRGGSQALHDTVRVGQTLRIGMPRNHFRFRSASAHVFIAGGIGITPILPMLTLAQAEGVPWRLFYIGREVASMPFVGALAEQQTTIIQTALSGRPDLDPMVADLPPGSRVYCCGPTALLDAVEAAHAEGRGPWAEVALTVERFAPRTGRTDPSREVAFEVELAHSGRVLPVPADVTVLEALAAADILVPSTCRQGTCGSCETRVLAGRVDHRDTVLTETERAADEVMMVCVSRAHSSRLTLDL